MKRHIGIIIVFLTAALCFGQKRDASDSIFNDSRIYRYDLTFYTDQWDSIMQYNKLNEEVYIPARFVWHKDNGDSVAYDSIGVRYKGNSSYNFAGSSPKKPYKMYFNKYRKDQKFFDVEKLNFSNLVHDPSHMREKISYDLCRRLMPVSRAVYAIITVKGVEIGLFLQLENVDEDFLSRTYKDDQSNLYKSSDNGTSLKYKGQNQSAYADEYELKTNTDKDDWGGLILMLEKLNTTSDSNFVKVVGKALDLDNCIRYLAFNMVTSNFDSYTGSGRNIYLYDDSQSKQFKLIPWDFNLGFGNYSGGWNILTVDAFTIPNLNIRPLAQRILGIDSLKKAYGRYISNMINNFVCSDTIMALAARIKPVIDSAVKKTANNFFDYDKFLSNIESDYAFKEGASITVFPGLKSFADKRFAELKKQLEREAIPVLNPRVRSNAQGAVLRCSPVSGGKNIIVYYSLKTEAPEAAIKIHNAKGEMLCSIVRKIKNAGTFTEMIDTRKLPAGFYTVSLVSGKINASAGIILAKTE